MTYELDRCIHYRIYLSRSGSLLPDFCSWSTALCAGTLLFLTLSVMYSSLANLQTLLCQVAHSCVKQCRFINTAFYIASCRPFCHGPLSPPSLCLCAANVGYIFPRFLIIATRVAPSFSPSSVHVVADGKDARLEQAALEGCCRVAVR